MDHHRASDQTKFADWVSQRVHRLMIVSGLSASRYRLMGGRLIATSRGPAAMLMYDDDLGTRLVILARPMGAEQNAPMSLRTQGAVSGFTWAEGGMAYSLVRTTEPELLRPIANDENKPMLFGSVCGVDEGKYCNARELCLIYQVKTPATWNKDVPSFVSCRYGICPGRIRMLTRRTILQTSASLFAAGSVFRTSSHASLAAKTITLPFENGERPLVKYPQKRPMIGLTSRPPQLETPISVLNENVITPNDAFFVRYHLAGIPLEIDPDQFSVEIKGKVNRPMTLSLTDIKKMPVTEIVAVNQCSGNSRGFFEPRVAGGQLGNGAMGNARWTGVPLQTVLDKAGIQQGAKQVVFGGLDGPVMETTPDFAKALDVDHARDGEVMLAYSMNGEPLPMLNGFPLRLIVPGYYGTYWVKHLNEITVVDSVFDGFWMKTAYRIPDTDCNCVEPGTAPKATIPINRFTVRSFITNFEDGATVRAGKETLLNGIAFDGGSGIKLVELSIDGGNNWMPANLGKDLGKYSFREWRLPVNLARGPHELKVRAASNDGKTQPTKPLWNPTGYLRNVVETVRITAA